MLTPPTQEELSKLKSAAEAFTGKYKNHAYFEAELAWPGLTSPAVSGRDPIISTTPPVVTQ